VLPEEPATLARMGELDADPETSDVGRFRLAEPETVPDNETIEACRTLETGAPSGCRGQLPIRLLGMRAGDDRGEFSRELLGLELRHVAVRPDV